MITVQKLPRSKDYICSEALTVCCSLLSVSNLLTGIIQVCRWPVRDRYLPQRTTCCLILYYCVKLANSIFGSQNQKAQGQRWAKSLFACTCLCTAPLHWVACSFITTFTRWSLFWLSPTFTDQLPQRVTRSPDVDSSTAVCEKLNCKFVSCF